jgi:LmbE family N-acetylglucosaminyl deacetylase
VGGFDAGGERHRADAVFFYMMHHRFTPSVVVDVSAVYEDRMAALACYRSQLHAAGAPATNVGAPDFTVRLRARHRFFGEAIGVEYGEPFAAAKTPGVSDLRALLG